MRAEMRFLINPIGLGKSSRADYGGRRSSRSSPVGQAEAERPLPKTSSSRRLAQVGSTSFTPRGPPSRTKDALSKSGLGLDQRRESVPATAGSRRAREDASQAIAGDLRDRECWDRTAAATLECVRNRGDTRRSRCGFAGAGRRGLHQRARRESVSSRLVPSRLVSARLGSARHGTARHGTARLVVVVHDDGCGTRSRRAKTLLLGGCLCVRSASRKRDLTTGPTNDRPDPAGHHEAGARLDARDHDAHARGEADPTARTGAKERRSDGASASERGPTGPNLTGGAPILRSG